MFKNIFKKKIILPLWFGFFGNYIVYPGTKEFNKALKKIAEALSENKNVITRINGQIVLIKYNKKIIIKKLLKTHVIYK